MRSITRSSHLAFSDCRRKGYWGWLWKGGRQGSEPAWPLVIGIAVHSGLELLLRAVLAGTVEEVTKGELMAAVRTAFIDAAGRPPQGFPELENLALAQALVLGWARVRLDGFIDRYEVISVEKESPVQLSANIRLLARCDAVVRDRRTGHLLVWNWKTASSVRDWTDQFTDDIQAMTEALAAQEDSAEYVSGCIFEGLYKASHYSGVSTSPLITGYREELEESTVWHAKRTAGAVKFSPWMVNGQYDEEALAQWIDWLPEDTVSDQFIRSHPVLKDDDMVRDWLKQVIRSESDIEAMLDTTIPEGDRLTYFMQNRGKRCKWCAFRPACRGEAGLDELETAGLIVPRQDHHSAEDLP